MRIKPLVKNNLFYSVAGFVFSFVTIFITSGLQIINPRNVGWLARGDGKTEIAWEFFRYQPIFQLPLGLNPKYGLEIASTIAFDAQIPIMSLLLHPFSSILGTRFQYIGIFLFITFMLNFYFASRIFHLLHLSRFQIIINSSLVGLSPVILNRFIENTHYTLTSAWLILWAIYLVLRSKNDVGQWFALFNFVPLIHFYYMPFVLILYLIKWIIKIYTDHRQVYTFITQFILIISSVITNMYLIGYFYGDISSGRLGYGDFKATLLSPFDSSGWSKILADLPEPYGAYEGFSYLGTATFLLLIVLITLFSKKNKKENLWQNSALSIWISSILLFIFSLSNKINVGTISLLEFPIPIYLLQIVETFRSSGRFAWLLVFVLFIWVTYKISLKLDSKYYSILLSFVLIFVIIDYWPKLVSEKANKFDLVYESNLVSSAWTEINKCYEDIKVYPPVLAVDNFYNFLNVAYSQKMGINTGRLGRFNQEVMNNSFSRMNYQFKHGKLDQNSFYIFTSSEFVKQDFVEFYKNIALKTLDENTGWGILDGYTFLAPDLKSCTEARNLRDTITSYGPLNNSIYKGGKIYFGQSYSSENYILSGVILNTNNFETIDNNGSIILNIDKKLMANQIEFKADQDSTSDISYRFTINNISEDCIFSKNNDSCLIKLSGLKGLRILSILIEPGNDFDLERKSELEVISLEIT